MKTLIALLLLCLSLNAATVSVTLTIPGLVTNAPGTLNLTATKTSQEPNTAIMQSNYLFLISAPSVPTNYNIAYGQLLPLITSTVTNGQSITNVLLSSFVSPTNGVSSATAIDFNVPEATTNIAANLAFTSIINFNPTNYNSAIRWIPNTSGGNLTLTVNSSWKTDPLLRTTASTYTITNNSVVGLLVTAQINFFTNATILIATP